MQLQGTRMLRVGGASAQDAVQEAGTDVGEVGFAVVGEVA
jgi:hypothetical protein